MSKEEIVLKIMVPSGAERRSREQLKSSLFNVWPGMAIKINEVEILSREGTQFFDQWEISCPLSTFDRILQAITNWCDTLIGKGISECILVEQFYATKHYIR